MELGTTFRQVVGEPPNPTRPFSRWISDVEKIMRSQEQAGFSYVAITHAYHTSRSHGMQPMLVLSRVSPISGNLRLSTEILQLPVYGAMDAAYNIASLDHITEGRLDVGVGIGYNPYEIGPAGVGHADRVPKFEENVEVMKKFWTGEPVYHQGRYYQVEGTQLQLLPVQKPHPPLLGASFSHGAAARAGRMLDGIIVGSFTSFEDLSSILDTFRGEWHKVHSEEPTRAKAWRTLIPGKDPWDAMDKLIGSGLLDFRRNEIGGMQEETTVKLRLDLTEGDATDWAILGTHEDLLEGLLRCRDEFKLTHVSCNFWNLPEDVDARSEWLVGFGEEVIKKL